MEDSFFRNDAELGKRRVSLIARCKPFLSAIGGSKAEPKMPVKILVVPGWRHRNPDASLIAEAAALYVRS